MVTYGYIFGILFLVLAIPGFFFSVSLGIGLLAFGSVLYIGGELAAIRETIELK